MVDRASNVAWLGAEQSICDLAGLETIAGPGCSIDSAAGCKHRPRKSLAEIQILCPVATTQVFLHVGSLIIRAACSIAAAVTASIHAVVTSLHAGTCGEQENGKNNGKIFHGGLQGFVEPCPLPVLRLIQFRTRPME